MKKILFILLGVVFSLGLFAQDKYITLSNASTAKVVDVFGTAADTLTASATKSYVVFVSSPFIYDIYAEVRTTINKSTGTPAYTAYLTQSADGTNYTAIANAANQSKSSGTSYDFIWKTGSNATIAADTTSNIGPYIKISLIATGASQRSLISGKFKVVKKFAQ
jgi:hypothetical protein